MSSTITVNITDPSVISDENGKITIQGADSNGDISTIIYTDDSVLGYIGTPAEMIEFESPDIDLGCQRLLVSDIGDNYLIECNLI